MQAIGKSYSSINGSLEASLLNLSRCNGEGGGHGYGVGADLWNGVRGMLLVDSSSDEEEAGSSFFPVKEIAHSLSLIFGLALVAFVLTHRGMDKGRTDARGSIAS